jgi:colanic acid biosynthesis glycosyl transferase WcaI
VLEAALKLNGTSSVSFVLAGDGTEARALAELKTKMALDNVTFLGRLSPEEMPHLQAASDVQLVSLVQDDLFAVTMPSKVQSILAAGKPLIVMAPGDAAEVVRTAGSGWAVRPGDPDDLARAILHAQTRTADELSAMGEAGREYYLRHMSRDVGGPRLDSILRRAAVYRRTGTVTNGEIRG